MKLLIAPFMFLAFLMSFDTNAIIHANTHFGHPRIEPGSDISQFEEDLLVNNVLVAIKFGDVDAIKANIAVGLNPFKVNKDGFSLMDAFISIGNNNPNTFGVDISVLVDELINFSKQKVSHAIAAAENMDAVAFEKLVGSYSFYYYTPIDASKLLGHKVVELGCMECLLILQENDYNLSVPAPDGTRIFN